MILWYRFCSSDLEHRKLLKFSQNKPSRGLQINFNNTNFSSTFESKALTVSLVSKLVSQLHKPHVDLNLKLIFGHEIKSFYFRTISEKMSFSQHPNAGLLPNQMDKVTVMNFLSTNVPIQMIHHLR